MQRPVKNYVTIFLRKFIPMDSAYTYTQVFNDVYSVLLRIVALWYTVMCCGGERGLSLFYSVCQVITGMDAILVAPLIIPNIAQTTNRNYDVHVLSWIYCSCWQVAMKVFSEL